MNYDEVKEIFTDEFRKKNNIKWKWLGKCKKDDNYLLLVYCECVCGNRRWVYWTRIKNLVSKGCLSCCSITHNMSHTRLYKRWVAMKNRCKDSNLKNYGGRGIAICDEWEEFIPFMNWALANGYDDGLIIERIDVNGDYCPENCIWTSMSKQAENLGAIFNGTVTKDDYKFHVKKLKNDKVKDSLAVELLPRLIKDMVNPKMDMDEIVSRLNVCRDYWGYDGANA